MAFGRASLTSGLLFLFHLAPMWAYPTMDSGDQMALEAVRAAVANIAAFPPIKCSDFFVCKDDGRVRAVIMSVVDSSGTGLGDLVPIVLVPLILGGSIAPEIGNLTELQTLDISGCQFTGSIPSSIGQLTSLRFLQLSDNQLSGSIPSSISQLTSLLFFIVSNNYLTGPIPQVNGLPGCSQLVMNCLFGSDLPSGCDSSDQRNANECGIFPPPPPPPSINRALNKVVKTQSSVLSTCLPNCAPSNMVDGKIPPNGTFSTSQCTSTELEKNSRPYVVIDLRKSFTINSILMYGRSDSQLKAVYDYFNKVEVWISSRSPYIASAVQCDAGNVYDYAKNGIAYPFRVNCGGMTGRWVMIRARRNTQLTLCEVEVY